jgi:hypothetical protein
MVRLELHTGPGSRSTGHGRGDHRHKCKVSKRKEDTLDGHVKKAVEHLRLYRHFAVA